MLKDILAVIGLIQVLRLLGKLSERGIIDTIDKFIYPNINKLIGKIRSWKK
jgi:hypothetical protein